MIEIREVKAGESKKSVLFIDGNLVDAEVTDGKYPSGLQINASDPEVINLILSLSNSELSSMSPDVLSLNFSGFIKLWADIQVSGKVNIYFREGPDYIPSDHIPSYYHKFNSECQIEFDAYGDSSRWRHPWTTKEYRQEFIVSLKAMNLTKVYLPEYDESSDLLDIIPLIKVSFTILTESSQIGTEIARYSNILNQIHEQTERLLKARVRADSVVMYFDFPIEVRASCEQYLLYFIEFLRDLGVEADAELKHDISGVLFSVTPTNTADALDKIRLALEVYLKLPSGSINDSNIMSEAIEVQRLSANIYHLKGQLSLAAAVIQAKDATIEAQRIMIGQQRLLLNGEVISDSMKAINTPVKEENREEILKDILAVTEYKGKGFELNLPEIIRRLKRLFSDK